MLFVTKASFHHSSLETHGPTRSPAYKTHTSIQQPSSPAPLTPHGTTMARAAKRLVRYRLVFGVCACGVAAADNAFPVRFLVSCKGPSRSLSIHTRLLHQNAPSFLLTTVFTFSRFCPQVLHRQMPDQAMYRQEAQRYVRRRLRSFVDSMVLEASPCTWA